MGGRSVLKGVQLFNSLTAVGKKDINSAVNCTRRIMSTLHFRGLQVCRAMTHVQKNTPKTRGNKLTVISSS